MERTQKKAVDKSTLRFLLIEDSDMDAYAIQRALKGYVGSDQCTRVSTLKAGEDILEKGETDVLLLDLGLPDTATPADTYARIKKWADKLPIIIMTNLKDHELARVMVHEGAADFLNKDDILENSSRIQNAIDFSIERHALNRELRREKEKATQDSKQKDSILNCFMGGYSINGGGK